MTKTKLFMMCVALFLATATLCGCAATNGGFSIVVGEPKPHLKHGIYDLNNVACYSEDIFKPEAYAYLGEAIREATADCDFPLNTDSRIAEYGLCIQPILEENGVIPEKMLLNSAVSFDDWKYIDLQFFPTYVPQDYIYDGEGYFVLVSAESGELLVVTDNWHRVQYGNAQSD